MRLSSVPRDAKLSFDGDVSQCHPSRITHAAHHVSWCIIIIIIIGVYFQVDLEGDALIITVPSKGLVIKRFMRGAIMCVEMSCGGVSAVRVFTK